MALNQHKSETILLDTRQQIPRYSSLVTVNVAGGQIPLSDQIKILGVTLDKNLSTDNHANFVSKFVHYHICASWHIRRSISEYKMAACALVGSRLDYANSVIYNATQKNLSVLQRAHNLLASVVTGWFQSGSHISNNSSTGSPLNTASISKYHFLHFTFLSTCLSVFSLHSHSFHSFSYVVKYQFALHAICLPSFVACSFSVAAPTIWNSFPPAL